MLQRLPVFLDLSDRRVVLVGAGRVAAGKLAQLLAAGADVLVVAPEVQPAVARAGVAIVQRAFVAADLDGAWLAVAAAPPEVNRQVAAAAAARRVFVNAVDDPAHATAYLGGVVRRGRVTVAISTGGAAPALAGLLREAIDDVLPRDLARWMAQARRQRDLWRRRGVPIAERRPLLLEALNALYARGTAGARGRREPPGSPTRQPRSGGRAGWGPASSQDVPPACPWLHGPEDTWL